MREATVYRNSEQDIKTRELVKEAQEGNMQAKEDLLLSYLPLAKKYAHKYTAYEVPFDDLFQEACYGLLIAIDRYDLNKQASFASCAIIYIQKYIRENALQKQNSAIPSCYKKDMYFEAKAYLAAAERLKKETGHEPTDQELSEELNISTFRVKRLKYAAATFMAPIHQCDYSFLENYCVEKSLRPVEDDVLRRECYMDISELNVSLTLREKEILERRFGFLQGGEMEPWAKISNEMGLSNETIRLAYLQAIKKIQAAMGID